MHIHILGIAGTFMGGIAQLAKAKGHQVTGSDKAIYPPMSTQLEQAGIEVSADDDLSFLKLPPDQVVIGNAMSRGHLAVEATLNAQQVYTSGPQWLAENLLHDRWVIAVAGTHGKTTTSAMVAWILEAVGLNPGFLIGGVPENFGVSARLGAGPFFVVEADEYDTAFFDKRSKFVHYHPRTLVMNNLEFDHADIFADLAAIQTQFHHLVRTVPSNGLIIYPADEPSLEAVLKRGCWTPTQTLGLKRGDWQAGLLRDDGSCFSVLYQGKLVGQVSWGMTGLHNVKNALSAIAASVHAGVPAFEAVNALCSFKGVRRRMTKVGSVKGITIYDDFAHHPTAIGLTLQGLKKQMDQTSRPGFDEPSRLIAVFEPRSNTMRLGVHKDTLPQAFIDADQVYAFIDPAWNWQLPVDAFSQTVTTQSSYNALLETLSNELKPGDQVVLMSNGSFGGLHLRLLEALSLA
ncbi:UDP-N-acetylmuramate:L-alanyl-gamma-D-glutamyl-meso-diaminopimelate ligase [Thiomicrospira microaerophila]|uniref:UDP-N-acetylmuramate:L-alanyl-gamma-D-glutamyl- meso-diaminopimelate ligase n=1 Tax=Thiomicrospira microaerophila TaxID=406020 RepID=UPI00200E5117|nr:UDP-N-acetylmuramate:L-alanyl-gamma-D-glutamyl-meso-diaminopimelate ligase [Thiomicrospira microaerophila]UQB42971.1 UDP-N-acetylmuramate:L-alanyl-gamma-D-glutamyl-meso-diaminopimelate ligase [Thiomicrospira microaerophila]